MCRIDEVELVVKGLSSHPHVFHLPIAVEKEAEAFIRQRLSELEADSEVVSIEEAFPELSDEVKGPSTVLRGARHRENLTQKQLADKLGIRQHHLSEMENGKRPIGKETAKKLAEVLYCDYRVFL